MFFCDGDCPNDLFLGCGLDYSQRLDLKDGSVLAVDDTRGRIAPDNTGYCPFQIMDEVFVLDLTPPSTLYKGG